MLISLVGLPFSGKEEIARWLVAERGFQRVSLDSSLRPRRPEGGPSLAFQDPAALLVHATENWRAHLVLTDPLPVADLDEFGKRPSFLLVRVDAGLMVRFQRRAVLDPRTLGADDLAQFALQSDESLYGPAASSSSSALPAAGASLANGSAHVAAAPSPLNDLTSFVGLAVVNNYTSLDALYTHLVKIKLDDPERLRPGWDRYFMTLASLASLRSNCMKRRVGALLVRSNRIVSTGYNGTPRGMRNCNEGGCARCNSGTAGGGGLNMCLCLHAEENALLEAGRERIGVDSILYCNTCPCLNCAIKIVQSGVKEVVYNLAYAMDEESARILKEGGVHLRRLRPGGPADEAP